MDTIRWNTCIYGNTVPKGVPTVQLIGRVDKRPEFLRLFPDKIYCGYILLVLARCSYFLVKMVKNLTLMNSFQNLDVHELIALSRLDIAKEDFSSALLKLKHAISFDGISDEAFSMLAKVYAQIGLSEKAISYFERFLQNNPDALLEKFQLGVAQLDAGQSNGALDTWRELLTTHPGYPPALYYSGLVLSQTDKVDGAIATLQGLVDKTATDNLYVERAVELLDHIRMQGSDSIPDSLAKPNKDITEALSALPRKDRTHRDVH